MRRRSKSVSGFEEASFTFHPRDDFLQSLSGAIAKARERTRAQRERVEAVQAEAEKRRRAAERKRRAGIVKWSRARAGLFAVVAAIDRAIGEDGMAMSVSDEPGHPVYLAVAQVRASVLGRAMPAVLEITVTDDLNLIAKVLYTDLKAPTLRLPPVAEVTTREFGDAILAYLECALPQAEAAAVRICEKCGGCLPG